MEYEIKMDFYGDWISFLKNQLQNAGYKINTNASQEDISIQYFNLLKRRVTPVLRSVLISNEFKCPSKCKAGLEIVKEKIEKGQDITPFLSTGLKKMEYDDGLLNDWGIHHLHLGTTMRNDGFVQRTGPVLFVRFDEEYAYFINVMDHGRGHEPWFKQELVRIIHRNWPKSIEQFRLKEVLGLSNPITDKDIKTLRGHTLTFIEPEKGVVYMPPGMGCATSGTSIEVVMVSDDYAIRMRNYEEVIRENIDEIVGDIKKHGINPKQELSFSLKIDRNIVYAYENNLNVNVNLGEL